VLNGAGGAVGTFAVQLAKVYGANVTGVDAPEKLDVLRSIGADQVLDYTQDDFTDELVVDELGPKELALIPPVGPGSQ
jgi:NADPH:quinone reductase-like Zn-dependent oxidoreductase